MDQRLAAAARDGCPCRRSSVRRGAAMMDTILEGLVYLISPFVWMLIFGVCWTVKRDFKEWVRRVSKE